MVISFCAECHQSVDPQWEVALTDGTKFHPRCWQAMPPSRVKYWLSQKGTSVATAHNFREQPQETVEHPSHYGGADNPYEHIKVVNAWGLNYELGSATKYIMRAGKKSPDPIEDLKKARFWVDYEIKKLERAAAAGAGGASQPK